MAATGKMRSGAIAVLASTAVTVVSAAPAAAATTCNDVSLTVDAAVVVGPLPVGVPLPTEDWVINGRLCAPTGASTVLLLQSGATYSSEYWDFRFQPETYSFVDYANAHGLATLNIDRLGIGTSSHPLPELVMTATHANIAHLFVQGLRSGQFGRSFSRVALAGHSFGSVVSVAEAGTYHDVDAVVLTALTHSVNTPFVTDFEAALRPAALVDPRFAGLPLGYLTTQAGARASFFHQPTADPAVIAYEESVKETFTDGENLMLIPSVLDTLTITAPVLTLVGQRDVEFCGLVADCSNPLSLVDLEGTFYPAAESFELRVIPDTAHNVNLQGDTHATFDIITSWVTGAV